MSAHLICVSLFDLHDDLVLSFLAMYFDLYLHEADSHSSDPAFFNPPQSFLCDFLSSFGMLAQSAPNTGAWVGWKVGLRVLGAAVGIAVGERVGERVGAKLGDEVGL